MLLFHVYFWMLFHGDECVRGSCGGKIQTKAGVECYLFGNIQTKAGVGCYLYHEGLNLGKRRVSDPLLYFSSCASIGITGPVFSMVINNKFSNISTQLLSANKPPTGYKTGTTELLLIDEAYIGNIE